jgi:hypothetical protein
MNEESWIQSFLTSLGVPVTSNNVNWVSNWIAYEGPFGTQTNPLNILDPKYTGGYSPSAAAQWLNTNGGYGGTGTYGQEVVNYLKGLPNQITTALSWFSGHSGQPVPSSVNQFYADPTNIKWGGSGTPSTPTSPSVPSASGTTTTQQGCYDSVGNFLQCVQGNANTLVPTAQQALPNVQLYLNEGGILLAAIVFILLGGLWIALGNQNTREAIATTAKTAVA